MLLHNRLLLPQLSWKVEMRWQNVPVPELMKHLPKDRRGFPIPANVQIDPDGTPHFAINPENTRQRLFREDRCSICGCKLLRGRWMVGGPASAFHSNGVYQDPPVHRECGRYALQACPYLAMPSYLKQVSTKTIEQRDVHSVTIVVDPTMIRNRPDPFVMVMYVGQTFKYDARGLIQTVVPKRPHRQYEFWADGIQLSEEEGRQRVDTYFQANESLFSDRDRWERPELRVIRTRSKKR
jgi:hypothetical protein